MSLPRLLLVTGVTPGRGSVGREYLRAACGLLPADRIRVFSFEAAAAEVQAPELAGITMHHEPPHRERGSGLPGEHRWRWIRHLIERRIERSAIPPLIERVVAFGREQGVDGVWVPLHSPTTVRVARPVAEALGLPLIVTVWDPPNAKLRQFGIGRHVRRTLLRTFDDTVRHARACSAASEPMRNLYQRLYGTPTVTMILGAPRPDKLAEPQSGGPFRLGFVGSLYATREFAALRAALDRNGWNLEGREIRLELFGNHAALEEPGRIHSHGWMDPLATVTRLSACNAAYLPYWFARRRREVVEVSFPGKLACYAAARTPVLFHGPSYASPVRFLERYPFGRVCATLDPQRIATALARLIRDDDWCERARQACDRAFEEELSAAVFRRSFAEFLGVDVDELISTPAVVRPPARV